MENPTFLESVKAYVGFDDQASAALRAAHDIVAPHFTDVIDDFYATIEAHPAARAAITGGATQIQRLKRSLLVWIDELFQGPHDEAYFERRARIGRVHVQIDLPQMYMFTAMDRIRLRSVDVLRDAPGLGADERRRMITALHRILDIELAIMLETYREDLLAKNRTAERLATIGQFAAGIGHELRNPLGVVESSTFLMRQRLEHLKITDPTITRHLEKITHEVHRSNRTITDLLELARSRPLQRRSVAAHAFITQAIPAANLPPSVEVKVDAPADIFLDADADQLTRVLTNLLINGSQAMNGSGYISVEARRGSGETQLLVRDEGPGVPAELQHRIFEALFTTKAKGSGLGLALCRRIVAAHGGNISLEPSARGAVFKVSVPDAGSSS